MKQYHRSITEKGEDMARTKIGYCHYCGESRMIEEPENSTHELDQSEIDEIATWECTCQAARKAREKEEQRMTCVGNIQDLIYNEYPDVAEILTECIQLVQDGVIGKVIFSTTDGRKLTLKDSKDGLLVRKEWQTALEVTA